jgi:hypothetical protein
MRGVRQRSGDEMTDEPIVPPDQSKALESVRGELTQAGPTRWQRAKEKLIMAAVGAIPWVGGFIAAAKSIHDEEKADQADRLQTQWLEEHQSKIGYLHETLDGVSDRIEKLGPQVEERIQSPEYLGLVRQAFRTWDNAETQEKRELVGKFLGNAAGSRQVSDDVLRLFLNWVALYHEAHFAVIRHIFKNPGSTRLEIWTELYGNTPREDSAEADLFKLLIRDLSTGSVIRIARDTNDAGQYLRKRAPRTRAPASSTVESAFEDTKPYVLTGMGEQFVHYTMNEIVGRLGGAGT